MFYLVGLSTFFTDVVDYRQFGLQGYIRFQCIGEIKLETFILAEFIAMFCQQIANLEVSHSVRCHHQFNGIEVGQDVVFDQIMNTSAAVFIFVLFYSHFDSFCGEGEGSGCWIKYRNIL